MKIEKINDTEKFASLKVEWNSLLEISNNSSIFLTWEWLFHWWTHFKNYDKELCILRVTDTDTKHILGIAPLFIEKIRFFNKIILRIIKFLGSEIVASDFLDFIIYPGAEDKVLNSIYVYLDKISARWDVIAFGDIDTNSSSLGIIKRNVAGKYTLLEQGSQTCPYIKLPESYELFQQSLSQNMRMNLKRRMKQLEGKKEAKFFICMRKEQITLNY
jgi:hypothetical protein